MLCTVSGDSEFGLQTMIALPGIMITLPMCFAMICLYAESLYSTNTESARYRGATPWECAV